MTLYNVFHQYHINYRSNGIHLSKSFFGTQICKWSIGSVYEAVYFIRNKKLNKAKALVKIFEKELIEATQRISYFSNNIHNTHHHHQNQMQCQ